MSTIAERLSAVDTKLNNILINANTQLTNKGKIAVSDLNDLPSAVGELKNPTGTKSITQNGTVDVSNYASANVNVSGGASEYNTKINTTIDVASNGILRNITKLPVFTFTSSDASSLFNNFRSLEECPEIDFSNVTLMTSTFNYCNTLTLIPVTLNTSNVISMEGLCMYCTSLVTFPLLDTSNNTNFFRAFDNCTSLVNFPQLSIPKVTNMKNMFRACESLSNESLNNILAMLASATSYNSTKTLAFIGLSSAQATTCTGLSNWAAAQAAGWTTGY